MSNQKEFFILAGVNGAGKTTLSKTILAHKFNCKNIVDIKQIAKGLSPFKNNKFIYQSKKIALQTINNYIKNKESFAIKTTLSSKHYLNTIRKLKNIGYKISLIFIHVQNSNIAAKRSCLNSKLIKKNYALGLQNLRNHFLKESDYYYIYDNSEKFSRIFSKERNNNKTSIKKFMELGNKAIEEAKWENDVYNNHLIPFAKKIKLHTACQKNIPQKDAFIIEGNKAIAWAKEKAKFGLN